MAAIVKPLIVNPVAGYDAGDAKFNLQLLQKLSDFKVGDWRILLSNFGKLGHPNQFALDPMLLAQSQRIPHGAARIGREFERVQTTSETIQLPVHRFFNRQMVYRNPAMLIRLLRQFSRKSIGNNFGAIWLRTKYR